MKVTVAGCLWLASIAVVHTAILPAVKEETSKSSTEPTTTVSPLVNFTLPLCKDGRGPLLEGDNNPFPCGSQCPQGFDCEHPIPNETLGICCPNLELLYKLYGKDDEDEETNETVAKFTTQVAEATTIVKLEDPSTTSAPTNPSPETTASAIVISTKPNTESSTASIAIEPVADEFRQNDVSPDRNLLKLVQVKEVRLSQEKLPIHRLSPSGALANPLNPFNPQNVEYDNELTRMNTAVVRGGKRANAEEFLCKRQKFEPRCGGGIRKTQVVIRWFAKDGECCAYPYGFCPGDTVKNDLTMRTKEDCESLCLSAVSPPPSAGVTVGAQSFDGTVSPSPEFPTLATPVQGDTREELVEVFPPGYSPEIDEFDNKTRVVLHSDVMEPIAVPAPNQDSDRKAKALEAEMESSASVPAMSAMTGPMAPAEISQSADLQNSVSDGTVTTNDMQKLAGQKSDLEAVKVFSEMTGLKLLMPSTGSRMVSSLRKKQRPKKSCDRLQSYRAMCPGSGMPSQFTVRWFVKAGMCCAYPYGYCHGENVFEETVINTRQECEQLCLGRIASEAPYHRV